MHLTICPHKHQVTLHTTHACLSFLYQFCPNHATRCMTLYARAKNHIFHQSIWKQVKMTPYDIGRSSHLDRMWCAIFEYHTCSRALRSPALTLPADRLRRACETRWCSARPCPGSRSHRRWACTGRWRSASPFCSDDAEQQRQSMTPQRRVLPAMMTV